MNKVLRKLLTWVTVLTVLAVAGLAQSVNYAPASFSGWSDVQEFGQWTMHSINSTATGAQSMSLDSCYFALREGPQQWFPLAVGVKVKVIDPGASLSETVTITGVATPTPSIGASQPGFACAFTATFANAHTAGARISPADGGLGSAIATLKSQGGTIVVTPGSGVTPAMITGANQGATTLQIVDNSDNNTVGLGLYYYNGTTYAPYNQIQQLVGRCTGTAGSGITGGFVGVDPAQSTIACSTAFVVATGAGTVMSRSGTLQNLSATSTAVGVNGSDGVVTVNKNGSAGALTCTFGATTACSDGTHSISFVAGDIISISYASQAASTLANLTVLVNVN